MDPSSTLAPAELYEQLRQEYGAVAPVLLPGDIPAWLVLSHREAQGVLNRSSVYTCDPTVWTPLRDGTLPADSPLRPITQPQPLIAFTDGAEHARFRNAVTTSLASLHRHGIRRHVNRHADRLIDRFISAGRADLVRDFAEQLPILVIAHQFGIPPEQAPQLGIALRDLVRGNEGALDANAFVASAMRDLVAQKKKTPGRDFASALLAHEAGLDDHEVEEHLRHALVAANENTVNLLANALLVVLTDQRFRGNLSGGQMTLPDALHLVMWDNPPLALVPNRFATGPTTLGGQQIQRGDMVMVSIAAGNRDPQVRPAGVSMAGNRAHLAFGNGPHECPGADIGLSIAETGIDRLLTRLLEVQLTKYKEELPVEVSLISSRLLSLPVTFTPGKPVTSPADPAPATPPSARVEQPSPESREAAAPAPRSWWPLFFRRRR
ncbi:cytochrome P450 [Streptomyces lavendulocolor]|uniref:cytochrome P450 n=1 Tax=Streptomyces lavendulocolor TaxID=67316 RepID=UPI003C2EB7FE